MQRNIFNRVKTPYRCLEGYTGYGATLATEKRRTTAAIFIACRMISSRFYLIIGTTIKRATGNCGQYQDINRQYVAELFQDANIGNVQICECANVRMCK